MSSFPDNFSATKSSSEGTKSRGEPGVGFSSAFGEFREYVVETMPYMKFGINPSIVAFWALQLSGPPTLDSAFDVRPQLA